MWKQVPIVFMLCGMATNAGCVRRVPEPPGVPPGAPHISWVIMSGDRDTPDRDFVCQSDPPNDCVVPVSRPDAQVFSDVHFYFHGAGQETTYKGSIGVRFFQGAPASHEISTNITVKKNESITNQSVVDIVTTTPGRYVVAVDLVATSRPAGRSEPIRQQIPVVVK